MMKAFASPESLKRLQDATKFLEEFVVEKGKGFIQYKDINENPIIGIGLYKTDKIAVQRIAVLGGTKIPLHQHIEREIFVVFEGELIIYMNGKHHKLRMGNSISIAPNKAHSGDFSLNTQLIAITIPASPDFPDFPDGGNHDE